MLFVFGIRPSPEERPLSDSGMNGSCPAAESSAPGCASLRGRGRRSVSGEFGLDPFLEFVDFLFVFLVPRAESLNGGKAQLVRDLLIRQAVDLRFRRVLYPYAVDELSDGQSGFFLEKMRNIVSAVAGKLLQLFQRAAAALAVHDVLLDGFDDIDIAAAVFFRFLFQLQQDLFQDQRQGDSASTCSAIPE